MHFVQAATDELNVRYKAASQLWVEVLGTGVDSGSGLGYGLKV